MACYSPETKQRLTYDSVHLGADPWKQYKYDNVVDHITMFFEQEPKYKEAHTIMREYGPKGMVHFVWEFTYEILRFVGRGDEEVNCLTG